MKKLFCLLLCVLFAAGAAACAEKPIDDVIVDIGGTDKPVVTEPASTDPAETENANETEPPEITEVPTEAPTPDPGYTPEPTKVPELPEGQVLWLKTMPTDLYGISEAEAEAWFADAVFVGDSIMLGWKNYNNSMLTSNPDFFGQTHFLCEGSYGAGHALEPVTDKSLHPIYQGEQRLLWDSIQMMGAKKVFICFGLNDVAIYGVEGTANNFQTLCRKIVDASPDVKIYIISAMYLIDDSNMKMLTNANLRKLNTLLRKVCEQNGYMFVDIASHLVGEDGYLLPEYCSDNYVHQTPAAYKEWAKILRSLAAHDIKWGY
ncbi:MAG: hypothetical protein K6G56_03270 [Clostridiales bacterium]|nr:hypothetical protein [Clostridiales bacterium]